MVACTAPSESVEVEVRFTCWPASGDAGKTLNPATGGMFPGASAPQAAPQSTVTLWPRATSTEVVNSEPPWRWQVIVHCSSPGLGAGPPLTCGRSEGITCHS